MRLEDGASPPSGPADPDEVVELVAAMARALETLHRTVGVLGDVTSSIVATQREMLTWLDELPGEHAPALQDDLDGHLAMRRQARQYRMHARALMTRAEGLVDRADRLRTEAEALLQHRR